MRRGEGEDEAGEHVGGGLGDDGGGVEDAHVEAGVLGAGDAADEAEREGVHGGEVDGDDGHDGVGDADGHGVAGDALEVVEGEVAGGGDELGDEVDPLDGEAAREGREDEREEPLREGEDREAVHAHLDALVRVRAAAVEVVAEERREVDHEGRVRAPREEVHDDDDDHLLRDRAEGVVDLVERAAHAAVRARDLVLLLLGRGRLLRDDERRQHRQHHAAHAQEEQVPVRLVRVEHRHANHVRNDRAQAHHARHHRVAVLLLVVRHQVQHNRARRALDRVHKDVHDQQPADRQHNAPRVLVRRRPAPLVAQQHAQVHRRPDQRHPDHTPDRPRQDERPPPAPPRAAPVAPHAHHRLHHKARDRARRRQDDRNHRLLQLQLVLEQRRPQRKLNRVHKLHAHQAAADRKQPQEKPTRTRHLTLFSKCASTCVSFSQSQAQREHKKRGGADEEKKGTNQSFTQQTNKKTGPFAS